MTDKKEEIQLMTELDVLRALRNLYLEKLVGARISYQYFDKKTKEPKWRLANKD